MRFFSRYKAKGQEDEISRLNGMFLAVFLVIAAIAVACGAVMTINIEAIFKNGLTADEYDTARILMMLMVFNLALTFPNSVLTCITSAHLKNLK